MPMSASPSGTFTIRYAQKVFHVDRGMVSGEY